ncbi:MAG: hypothetical protein DRJ67_09405 [Thermoprotei archaeon]|nr:MAG: hypothetical protein DRJ67_09405 [Thermoprotei archaeon]
MPERKGIVERIETLCKELGIPFKKHHFKRQDYVPSYTSTFSWNGLRPRILEGLTIDEIEHLIRKLKDRILIIITESEQHQSIYNLWLRIDTIDYVYMIKLK